MTVGSTEQIEDSLLDLLTLFLYCADQGRNAVLHIYNVLQQDVQNLKLSITKIFLPYCLYSRNVKIDHK